MAAAKDYFDGKDFAAIKVREIAEWRHADSPGALRLPPIQRSLVWRNTQIINYWDSLLRGYPAGLFLVHRAGDAAVKPETEGGGATHSAGLRGGDASGRTISVDAADWQLFDGQQRMTTLLLGAGMGQLANDLRLWVDFGAKAPQDLKYALRISSRGQPFGYQLGDPGKKQTLGQRKEQWEKFSGAGRDRSESFRSVDTLIGAEIAVPFEKVRTAVDDKVSWQEFCDEEELFQKFRKISRTDRSTPMRSRNAGQPSSRISRKH